LLTEHLAEPVSSTSPDPMIETSAVSIALALTAPEPTIDTFAARVSRPAASTSPETRDGHLGSTGGARRPDIAGACYREARFAHPIDSTSMSPDPPIEALNSCPSARSMRMSPEPPDRGGANGGQRNVDHGLGPIAEIPIAALRADFQRTAVDEDLERVEHLGVAFRADRMGAADLDDDVSGPARATESKPARSKLRCVVAPCPGPALLPFWASAAMLQAASKRVDTNIIAPRMRASLLYYSNNTGVEPLRQ
jgi:hypothetical protein